MSWGKIRIDKADRTFSLYIRTRDDWTCQNPKCNRGFGEGVGNLHNSHYWGRGRESVRFDPENCDAICASCHLRWGGDYREEYTAFKIAQLGQDGYNALKLRAHQYKKKDREWEHLRAKARLEDLKKGT